MRQSTFYNYVQCMTRRLYIKYSLKEFLHIRNHLGQEIVINENV